MAGVIKDIEVFATGTYKGVPYVEKDLDDIIRNFNDFSKGKDALISPPAVIGHEEDQSLLENTGIPSMGTVIELRKSKQICNRCDGMGIMRLSDRSVVCPVCLGDGKRHLLKADVADMPDSIARIVNERRYKKVSAEIYDEDHPPPGVPAKGKMFRRLALLGGELPHVKGLKDIPKAEIYKETVYVGPPVVCEFSERRGFQIFSEITMPDKNDMMGKLASYGGSSAVLGCMDEGMMSECLKMCAGYAEKKEAALLSESNEAVLLKLSEIGKKKFGEKFKVYVESPHAGSDKFGKEEEEEKKKNAEHGIELEKSMKGGLDTTSKLSEKKEEEEDKKKKEKEAEEFAEKEKKEKEEKEEKEKKEKKTKEFAEKEKKEEEEEEEKKEKKKKEEETKKHSETKEPAMFSEKDLEPIVTKLFNAALEKVNSKIEPLKAMVDDTITNTKRQQVETFCETYLQTGHISPAELASGDLPTLKQELLNLDSVKVHKFGERSMTDLEVAMEKIKRRVPRPMKEKIAASPEEQKKIGDLETQHVKRFAEENQRYLKQCGFTVEKFTEVYQKSPVKEREALIKDTSPALHQKFCEMGIFTVVAN